MPSAPAQRSTASAATARSARAARLPLRLAGGDHVAQAVQEGALADDPLPGPGGDRGVHHAGHGQRGRGVGYRAHLAVRRPGPGTGCWRTRLPPCRRAAPAAGGAARPAPRSGPSPVAARTACGIMPPASRGFTSTTYARPSIIRSSMCAAPQPQTQRAQGGPGGLGRARAGVRRRRGREVVADLHEPRLGRGAWRPPRGPVVESLHRELRTVQVRLDQDGVRQRQAAVHGGRERASRGRGGRPAARSAHRRTPIEPEPAGRLDHDRQADPAGGRGTASGLTAAAEAGRADAARGEAAAAGCALSRQRAHRLGVRAGQAQRAGDAWPAVADEVLRAAGHPGDRSAGPAAGSRREHGGRVPVSHGWPVIVRSATYG